MFITARPPLSIRCGIRFGCAIEFAWKHGIKPNTAKHRWTNEKVESECQMNRQLQQREISARSSAIDDDSTLCSKVLTTWSMPHQMQRNGQALFVGSKAVARRTRAAVRPMPHQSPTSGASSVQRAIRTSASAQSCLDAASCWLSLRSTASAVNACLEPAPFSNRLARLDRRRIRTDDLRSLVRYRETSRASRFA